MSAAAPRASGGGKQRQESGAKMGVPNCPKEFTPDDPRYGWIWGQCHQDALTLIGSRKSVKDHVEDKHQTAARATQEKDGSGHHRERTVRAGEPFDKDDGL